MTFDLYVWKSPRDVAADDATAMIDSWEGHGADPAASPFEPSEDVGWFHRELTKDEPDLDVASDAIPNPSTRPIWLSTEPEPPARLVAIRLAPTTTPETAETILGLASKYDLVLFDRRNRRVHLPLDEMAEYASATFWPAGAIQAAVAGGAGAVIGLIAWSLGIPIVSGVVAVIGAFMFAMAVWTFVHEGRKRIAGRD